MARVTPIFRPVAGPPRGSDRRVQTACLVILTMIAIGVAMAQLQQVLVPFILAIFFSQCLSPLIHLLIRRFHMPPILAVTIAVLIGVGILVGAGFIVTASVGNKFTDQGQFYKERMAKLVDNTAHSKIAQRLNITAFLEGQMRPSAEQINSMLSTSVLQTTALLFNGATIPFLMAFLLYGRRWDRSPRVGIRAEIEIRVQTYISLTVFISVLTGVLVGASLSILGVQLAAVFGLLAFLLNFIPNFGAVIATLLPIPIVLLDPQLGWVAKLLAIAIPAAWQLLIGSLLQPRMLGNSLDLHPVVVLMALVFFTKLWGVGGAFLSTPMTAVIKIILEKIPTTRPLAAALAGDLNPLTRTIDPDAK